MKKRSYIPIPEKEIELSVNELEFLRRNIYYQKDYKQFIKDFKGCESDNDRCQCKLRWMVHFQKHWNIYCPLDYNIQPNPDRHGGIIEAVRILEMATNIPSKKDNIMDAASEKVKGKNKGKNKEYPNNYLDKITLKDIGLFYKNSSLIFNNSNINNSMIYQAFHYIPSVYCKLGDNYKIAIDPSGEIRANDMKISAAKQKLYYYLQKYNKIELVISLNEKRESIEYFVGKLFEYCKEIKKAQGITKREKHSLLDQYEIYLRSWDDHYKKKKSLKKIAKELYPDESLEQAKQKVKYNIKRAQSLIDGEYKEIGTTAYF